MGTTPEPITASKNPQVLLFGHSGSGKSALLGALYQAGQIQTDVLRGEIVEPTGSLAEIRDAIYRQVELERSNTEVTQYTLQVRPWRDGELALAVAQTFVLSDCSGQAAEGLIQHPGALQGNRARGPIARAVVEADAIILMVDAASDEEELMQAFEEFDNFLTLVAQSKEDAREVGGFPVYLVLTKCDALARPAETWAQWEQRIQNRMNRAERKFKSFFREAEPEEGVTSPFLPFGGMDLSVYAVAIAHPSVVDRPAQPTTPYWVAELFRDCFQSAQTQHSRVAESNRRLKWTVFAVLAFVAALFLGVVTISLFPPHTATLDLAERVTGYQLHEPEAAVRLADANLPGNRKTLEGFRDDPGFISLQDELRTYVTGRIREIVEYEKYQNDLLASTAPGDTRSLDELAQVESRLQNELALPPQYAWGDTAAAQLRDKWLADITAIRSEEERYLDRYRNLTRRGTVFTLSPRFGGNWLSDVNSLLNEASSPPADLSIPLVQSPALNLARGQALTNRIPYEFERVYQARRDWDATRERLKHLRDLAGALGLTEGAEQPGPALVIPEPGPGVNSATLPGTRMFALHSLLPGPQAWQDWETTNFPDPGRSILNERLERSTQAGARHVHALLQRQMRANPEVKDTPEGWRSLAAGLIDPEFADWGRLLQFLQQLREPGANNPVTELASFFRQKQFPLDTNSFELMIPLDLSLDRITVVGPLTITVTTPAGTTTTKQYKQSGSSSRVGSAMKHSLVAESTTKLVYEPGDTLKAELPLRAGTQDLKLVWENGPTNTFQFDRLSQEPRLIRAGNASEPATGVRLTPSPGSSFPQLPMLFPQPQK